MGSWMLELMLYIALAIALGYVFYSFAFSSKGDDPNQLHGEGRSSGRRFERRAAERRDRRSKNLGPPPNEPERRDSSRRG